MSSTDLPAVASENALDNIDEDLTGYFGDTIKCCPSIASISSTYDSGLPSSASLSSLRSVNSEQLELRLDNNELGDIIDYGHKRSPKIGHPPLTTLMPNLFSWCILSIFAFIYALCLRLGFAESSKPKERDEQRHFTPLYGGWNTQFTDFIYRRFCDIVSRPICSTPAARTTLLDRCSYDHNHTYVYPGTTTEVINLGSYNYLGFAQNDGVCARTAERAIDEYGIGVCSTMHEYGNTQLQLELERETAEYLGVDAAICCPMGFGTNAMCIPSLIGSQALILSDELNHASLIIGMRLSGADVKLFKHNNVKDCERQLINALSVNPYKKILIIVEGLYSMEGTIVHLREFVALKKKYKAYLFMDEAHSIGSVGRTGRGVCEYWRVAHSDVDILMGTFTKSFAAAGGYMAGRQAVINRIRRHTHGAYASTISAPVAQQIISSLRLLKGTNEGRKRLTALRVNTRYFRKRLEDAGIMLIGNEDSPIVAAFIFYPCKIAEFSRRLLQRHIGVVMVGFPATPVAKERVRFCMSSDHTKEQLDYALDCVIEEADRINCRFPHLIKKQIK